MATKAEIEDRRCKRPFIVQAIQIGDVMQFDKIRYNTNNHWENGPQPGDYDSVCEATSSKYWISLFKSFKTIRVDLSSPVARWLREAHKFGVHTMRFPRQLEDERDMLSAALDDPEVFDGTTEYFVRTENVSLKHGMHGVGPYKSIREIIESLVTCIEGHTPIMDNCDEIVLYLIPWVHIDSKREYRVFVCDNRITAASQQHLYNVFDDMSHMESDIRRIAKYFDSEIKPRITNLTSYVMDIAVVTRAASTTSAVAGVTNEEPVTSSSNDGEEAEEFGVYFIELNPFGKEYPSGSALFGWMHDTDILYGRTAAQVTDECAHLRYTVQ